MGMLNRLGIQRVVAVVFGTSEQAETADAALRACAWMTVDDLLVTDGVSWVSSLAGRHHETGGGPATSDVGVTVHGERPSAEDRERNPPYVEGDEDA